MRIRVYDMSGNSLLDWNVNEKFQARVEVSTARGATFVFADMDAYESFGWFTRTARARRREIKARKKFDVAYKKEQAAKLEKEIEAEKKAGEDLIADIFVAYANRDSSTEDFGYSRFLELFGAEPTGICFWPGCGKSSGKFNPDNPVGDAYFCIEHCQACNV